MTKNEILSGMELYGFTRQTLAEATGYKYEYVRDRLTPTAAEPPAKFAAAVKRAFAEEERRREVDMTKAGASVWDLVYFSGKETDLITKAKAAGGYKDLPTLYHDAIVEFAEQILKKEAADKTDHKPGNIEMLPTIAAHQEAEQSAFWLDLVGGIAAGSKITSDCPPEPIRVAKAYDAEIHYALKVFGQSMEPKIKDGAIIVVKKLPAGWKPKKGSIVVYEDSHGASLKEFGYRKASAGEEADVMGNVAVLRSLNKAFPDITPLDGGRILAVYVETV